MAAINNNGIATVTIDGLECEVTYDIIAGGTLNGALVGPRSSHGTITSGPCLADMPTPSVATLSMSSTSVATPSTSGKEEIRPYVCRRVILLIIKCIHTYVFHRHIALYYTTFIHMYYTHTNKYHTQVTIHVYIHEHNYMYVHTYRMSVCFVNWQHIYRGAASLYVKDSDYLVKCIS